MTPTQEPARAGELPPLPPLPAPTDWQEHWDCKIPLFSQQQMREYAHEYARHLAQPAVPEGVEAVAGWIDGFVEGAKWWEWHKTGATMWQSDQAAAHDEAQRKLQRRLSTPQPAAQESAQPAGEQERRENSKHWPLLDRVEFALRDAGFDLDEAFAIAHHVSLTYPPQPESAQGERGAVDDAVVERALSYRAKHEDGACWPDDYSAAEQQAEREAMRSNIAAIAASGPKAYCRACQRAGMSNCAHFDECDGATCITCHRPLNTTPTGGQNARAVTSSEVDEAVRVFDLSGWVLPLNQQMRKLRAVLESFAARRSPAPVAQVGDGDAIRALIERHAAEIEDGNEYAYFELAYTRATGWMAWVTDKPLCAPVTNPDRIVIAKGQGDTPDAACADALARTQENG